jgi:hypothetical protein
MSAEETFPSSGIETIEAHPFVTPNSDRSEMILAAASYFVWVCVAKEMWP